MEINTRAAIVTGAYGAIGLAIATGLASNGYRVTLVGRDEPRLAKARATIVQQTSNPEIFIEVADLGLQQAILEFSRRWKGPLHLLVNNAATSSRRRTETTEGIEVQWATNVLGYFWMIKYFQPFMENLDDTRIVNVSSYWAGGLDINDPEFKSRPYDNDAAYRQAKQANRMLSVAFSERLKSIGISVNACHSGDVNSKLSNAFGFGGSETPQEGAATPLFLSLSKELAGVTGKYFEHGKQAECQFSRDPMATKELFEMCNQY